MITEYTICALPENNVNYRHYAITVAYRGDGRWAVTHMSHCLSADGQWDYEMRPSERDDDWVDDHRFDEQTALRLAEEQAPLVTCNGLTVTDLLARSGR
ncbi:hypothetical protein [Actinoplanes sp. URMC 104]|uniref:hypothetical protein n=1 Tax=Actinoplanes sp. URMC 104 TaxID=3423409 RepID=UPI003F19EE6C